MRAGDVADVVEVEREHRAEAGVPDRFARARQPLLVQAIVVDPLLPVLGHRAPGGGRLRTVIFHRCFLTFLRRRHGLSALAHISQDNEQKTMSARPLAKTITVSRRWRKPGFSMARESW